MSGADAVRVRPATRADARAIGAFAAQLYALHHAWDAKRFWDLSGDAPERVAGREAFFAAQAEAEDTILLVAERSGVVVGYAYLAVEDHDYESLLESAVWLNDLFVAPGERGRGVADALFIEARARAAATGHATFVLHVAEANARAQRFFARHGMRLTMREMTMELGRE